MSMTTLLFASALSVAMPNADVWPDTDGVHINAHGGGLLKDGDTWYWYGEHKVAGKAGNRAQVGVGVYSSKDLRSWKNEGIALKVTDAPSDIEKDCILERPKVVKAPGTGKYVMVFHLERKGLGYADARSGFAVADRPEGPFAFVKSCWPNEGQWPVNAKGEDMTPEAIAASKAVGPVSGGPSEKGMASNLYSGRVDQGQMARDMTLFVDDDGTVWHVFASESNSTLHFSELSPDCLGYTGRWYRHMEKDWTEAPAVVKHGGWYWLLGSGCTGWRPNTARIYRAKSLAGPWERLGNPCTGVNPKNRMGPGKTWGGQSTFIFHDDRTGRDIACFDIWRPDNAMDGRYVWLPIEWKGDGMPEIPWRDTFESGERAIGCSCGAVPERQNDFYWENDIFGMRAYGPGEDHRWSGFDIFNKMPDAGSVGELLKNHSARGNWHVKPSDGILDNYAIGPGRGCGGVAVYGDGEWKTYPDWEKCEIITNTPEKVEFKLVYAAFSRMGRMTCRITLERGSPFFRNEVSFEHGFKDAFTGPGLDVNPKRGHKGDVCEDAARGIVSLYEESRGDVEGSTMTAVFLDPKDAHGITLKTDHQGSRIIALDAKRTSFTYWAGARWSKRGDVKSAEEWHSLVRGFAESLSRQDR
ncbi:MAG: DUF4861 family protein [Kiritimatiellae bacterium]|nr:DUF4861 family protein [Kiritimatiellia bacterium]